MIFIGAMQGKVAPAAAADVAAKLYDLGCFEVSMGDTNGVGTPASIAAMFQVIHKSERLGDTSSGSLRMQKGIARLKRVHNIPQIPETFGLSRYPYCAGVL